MISTQSDRFAKNEYDIGQLEEKVTGLYELVAELHDQMDTVRNKLGLINQAPEPVEWDGNPNSIGSTSRIGQ